MTDVDPGDLAATPPQRPPAGVGRRRSGWLRANLFNSVSQHDPDAARGSSSAGRDGPAVVRWAVVDAVWTAPNGRACRGARRRCWAFIGEKLRFILFGRYPYAGALAAALRRPDLRRA